MTGRAIGTRLAIAQARAEAARARFSGTLGILQHRASPHVLAHDVATSLKERGLDALLGFADAAKRRPARVGLALTLLGLFFARHQIVRLLRRTASPTAPSKSPKRGSSK